MSSSIDTPLNIDTLKQRTVKILEKNGEIDVSRSRSLYSEIFNEKFDFSNFEGLRHLDKLSKFFAHYCKDIIDVVRTGKTNGVCNIRLKNEQTNEELEPSTSSQAKLFRPNSSEQQVSSASTPTTLSASQQQKPSSVNSTTVLPAVHEQQNPRSRKKYKKARLHQVFLKSRSKISFLWCSKSSLQRLCKVKCLQNLMIMRERWHKYKS